MAMYMHVTVEEGHQQLQLQAAAPKQQLLSSTEGSSGSTEGSSSGSRRRRLVKVTASVPGKVYKVEASCRTGSKEG